MAAKAEIKFRVPARNVKAVASWHVPRGKLGGRSDSAGARPACRSGRERSSHHGRQKRALAYARRRLKPKNGGFWSAQFCGEMAHPTRFERVTFAFGGQTPTPPISEQRIYSVARMGCCKPLATTPQRAALLRVTLPSETALWLFHDVDRRRKLKGRAGTWMSHHRIPRLDGDQAQRCDGNLPFVRRLMAVLSMTAIWAGQALVEGEIPFSGGSSNGGFWPRKVENALSFNGG